MCLSIRKVLKQSVVIMQIYLFANYIQNFILHLAVNVNSICRKNCREFLRVDFDASVQLLITYFSFVKYLRKNWNTMKQCISYLLTS